MKITYDALEDALYLRLTEGRNVESEEVSPGIVLDSDADRRVTAIEIINATRTVAAGALPLAAE
jgi:uncharacterized protein YuzE